jgi:DsbC/DsbD-like thiol-disulfide interchange protein
VRLHWPRPHVFDFNGLSTVGYKGEFVLPMEVIPNDPGRPIRLKGSVELGVCDDICLPASFAFDTLLSGAGAPDPVIDAALADRPVSADQAGLAGIGCAVDPIKDGLRITATMALPDAGDRETVVFETATPGIWVSEAETPRQGRTLTARPRWCRHRARPSRWIVRASR